MVVGGEVNGCHVLTKGGPLVDTSDVADSK